MIEIVKQDFEENKKKYNKLVEKLEVKLPSEVQITHIGSTEIPNMYGKNIIDILIGVKTICQFNMVYNILIDIGFIPSAKNKAQDYQFFASTSRETKTGDIHIHLAMINTNKYKDFILSFFCFSIDSLPIGLLSISFPSISNTNGNFVLSFPSPFCLKRLTRCSKFDSNKL